MRPLLRLYAEARLQFAQADGDPGARERAQARSSELQRQLWGLTGSDALLVTGLNELVSVSAESAATLASPIPPAVLVMLTLLACLAGALLGCRHQGPFAGAVLALMLALVLGTVIDLDQPQRGFIRVSLEPLSRLVL